MALIHYSSPAALRAAVFDLSSQHYEDKSPPSPDMSPPPMRALTDLLMARWHARLIGEPLPALPPKLEAMRAHPRRKPDGALVVGGWCSTSTHHGMPATTAQGVTPYAPRHPHRSRRAS